MANEEMLARITSNPGFIAALDQSGGSTPGALQQYGIPGDAYSSDADMFRLMHEMRVRIVTASAFTGQKVVGAILFEATMDGQAEGKPVPSFLWKDRGVVPFLKVDKGLEEEAGGVRLMKPIPGLDALIERARRLGIFGTKMRSVIEQDTAFGIATVVAQQFEYGARIHTGGLMPILEPEVSIKAQDKAGAEKTLREEIRKGLDALPADRQVMLKLTIPSVANFYQPLIEHPRVARVVALSGGYTRSEACKKLAQNEGMIASFSRALINDLKIQMSDDQFNAQLAEAIDEIYTASTVKI